MNAKEVMAQLESFGNAQTRKIYTSHGVTGPCFGVKVGDMKTIVKKVKVDTDLARALYRTGNCDAMYLAGLLADGSEMTPAELDEWAKTSTWHMVSEYTVAWVASEHPDGWKIGHRWIDSAEDKVSAAGWSTFSSILSTRPDEELDRKSIEKLLRRVTAGIHDAPNRTRHAMNGFVIAVGCFFVPFTDKAVAAAEKIGKVTVDMGGTACKVPPAAETIAKLASMGRVGKKRKSVKC